VSTVAEREALADEPADIEVIDETRPRARWFGYLGLALIAYLPPLLTAPGRVAADTKQYLYLDPGRMLGRAVSMWDPHIGMGTVTHQNIGYVFPMGPYYWLMNAIGVPAWVSQRLWLGSLVFFAGLGVVALLRSFDVRGSGVFVGALAFMLTPYVLDYAARISVLLMPWAALPWLVLVVRKALREERGGLARWRYPAIFALIIQVIGGVNATALLFAGLGPALWILYAWAVAHEVTFRRAAGVALRTLALTFVTSLWWISGLRMQAAYGLDILRYTETVDTVARTSTPNEVLRGLGYWFFYGQDRLGPWIEAARDYTQHLWVILAGYVLVALALLGAGVVRWRHRVFLIAMLAVGVIIAVGANPYAHPTPLGGIFKSLTASSTAALAMRSTARAVPLVVLALAMFLALGTNAVSQWFRRHRHVALAIATPVIVIVLILVNFPALYDGTYYGKNLQRPEQIPSYWTQAIAALSAGGNATRVLEEPGSDFASYRWGNTVDPITPGLTDRPYVARELIPYGTAGSADLLNAIDRRLQEGIADPQGLAQLWRRMGIGDVVARNDIQYERYNLVPPRVLAAVLAETPGLGTPQQYGAPIDTGAVGFQNEVSLGNPPTGNMLAPVVVYPVLDATPIVRAESTDHALMVSGDGEGLVDVADAGLLNGAGVVQYAGSYGTPTALRAATGTGDDLVVTDNNRLRARRWTSVLDNVGYTEQANGADAPLSTDTGDARLPLFPDEPADAFTTTQQVGVQRVVASAYGNTITYTPEDRASRAIDGDPLTAWRTMGFGDARGQKIRIDMTAPITTDHVNLAQPINGPLERWITKVQLSFDGKSPVTVALNDASRTAAGQTISFPKRTFRTFQVTIKQTSDNRTNLFGQEDAVGFSEIRLRDEHATHDVAAQEYIVMPTDLTSALGDASATHSLVFVMRRDAARPVPPRQQPELNIAREFTVPTSRLFTLTGNGALSTDASAQSIETALGYPDAAQGGVTMSASASLPGCLECTPTAAIDGNDATAWETPFIQVIGQWAQYTNSKPLTFDHLDMHVLADGRHSVPTQITLTVDGHSRVVSLPPITDQNTENATTPVHLTFPPMTGKTIRVTIDAVREERSKEYGSLKMTLEPVGITGLGLPGLRLPPAPATIDSGCRRDLLAIDGQSVPVDVTGRAQTANQVMALTLHTCGSAGAPGQPGIMLSAGVHHLTTALGRNVGWSIDRLVLASPVNAGLTVQNGRITQMGAPAPPGPTITVSKNGETSVTAHVTGATAPFWMVLGQSQSAGWKAHVVGGPSLGSSQLVDGYANGWRVTPTRGSFDVVMQWTPQRQVWLALWLSLLAALGCVLIIALTWRRAILVATSKTARPGDGDVSLGVPPGFGREVPARVRWGAPLLAGLIAGLTVSPWAGILVAVVTLIAVHRPRARVLLMLLPAALLFVAGVYLTSQQFRYHFPSVFEWPTLFPHARTPAWIAVMLLVGDAIVETALMQRRANNSPDVGSALKQRE
jgi:hypothetical protein